MSNEVDANGLIFDRNVVKTGSSDTLGIYSEGGRDVQFERGIEGKPQVTDTITSETLKTLPFVGIYRQPGDSDVGAVYLEPQQVVRSPNHHDSGPADGLRKLVLRHAVTNPELKA